MTYLIKNIGLFWLLSLLIASAASAQQSAASAVELLDADAKLQEVTQEYREHGELLDMSTPLAALLKLELSLQEKDFVSAAEFLDMRYLGPELADRDPVVLLQQLGYIWSRQRILDISAISEHAEGRLDDGLPSYRDLIGTIELKDRSVPIYLQRVPEGNGKFAWKLSNATVAEIPAMWEELGYGGFSAQLKELLPEVQFLGLQNWQLVYLFLMAILGWPITGLVCRTPGRFLVRRPGPFQDAVVGFLHVQFRIFLYIMLIDFFINNLGFPMRAQIMWRSAGLSYVAMTILLIGVINLIIGYQTRRMIEAGNDYYIALLKPAATVIKVILILFIALVWASRAGFNISTILAGLGVGSLAVALAAQKTLENIIGAITIYTARPIKPGDFCRFGTTVGVVEEIGLRSTVLRTLNRTLVSVPNAVFAAAEVENFAERDRIRYFRYLRLEIGSVVLMESILEQVRALFAGHEQLRQDTISIRLDEISDNTVQIRIDAGVATTDFQEYLVVAEALNLKLIDIVYSAGGRFSGPAQHVTLQQSQHDDPLAIPHTAG